MHNYHTHFIFTTVNWKEKTHLPIRIMHAYKKKTVWQLCAFQHWANFGLVIQQWSMQKVRSPLLSIWSCPTFSYGCRPAYSLASVAHFATRNSTEFLLSHWFTLVPVHCFRFALVAEDGVVKAINVEPDGTGLTCSKAADVMKLLWCLHWVAPAAKLPLCTCMLLRVWAAPLCSHQSLTVSAVCHPDTS